MKKIISLLILVLIFFVAGLIYLNRNQSLMNLENFPSEHSIEGAALTSIEHFSDKDAYLYHLNDDEFVMLLQLLSQASVKKSFGAQEATAEYYLIISSKEKDYIFPVNDHKMSIGFNQLYELQDHALTDFLDAIANKNSASQT